MDSIQWTQPLTHTPIQIANYKSLLQKQIGDTFCKGRRPHGASAVFDHFVLLLVADRIRKDYNYYSLDRIYHYMTSLENKKVENEIALQEANTKLVNLHDCLPYNPPVNIVARRRQRRLINRLRRINSEICARQFSDLFELHKSLSTVSNDRQQFLNIVKSVAVTILKKAKFGQSFTLKAACYNVIAEIIVQKVSLHLSTIATISEEVSKTISIQVVQLLPLPQKLVEEILENVQSRLFFESAKIQKCCFSAASCDYYRMLCKICRKN